MQRLFLCLTMVTCCLFPAVRLASAQQARVVHSAGNPILADGQYYSADAAPLVSGDTLYILAGRDEAGPEQNDFIMNEWQMLTTKDPGAHRWMHYPGILHPEKLFAWAAEGHAYAGQIVEGPDKRFYLYAPVEERDSKSEDTFAIGVAVAPSPLGPWKDAHPAGPIVSQARPVPNRIQNIDPTAMVDDDGRVYLYWGTFGKLHGMELERDMVTFKGPQVNVTTLTGFFEAAWLMKRAGTYYMVYAGNQAGPQSPCTPAIYHACIAYGTAASPLGPWTYRGVVLDPVSSTTSHPGVVEFKGRWYMTYHTADARGGNHFRRSVAIDEVHWDDTVSPPRMLKVQPTVAPRGPAKPTRNLALAARASASNEPVPVQYWIAALNDGIVRPNPLPPDMWGSWSPHNPASQWIQYTWSQPVTLDQSRMVFWADHPAGAAEGVAPPASWSLEYWGDGGWKPVAAAEPYPAGEDVTVRFAPVRTRCLRAMFQAAGGAGQYAGVAVQEWEALTPAVVSRARMPEVPGSGAPCDARP